MAGGRTRWGWHRLEPAWAGRLVAEAGLPVGACVLDIGAGDGVITRPLVATGARVIAVELHPSRAAGLREAFGRSVVVVHADAADLRLPRRAYHVVANPPFGITSALLRRLLQPGTRLETAHLVVQEQVARRWAGRDAPSARRWGRTHVALLGSPDPRRAFHPRPGVDARVLVLRRR